MSERSSTYITPHLDYGQCMAVDCHLRAYYRTARTRFCAWHWRRAVIANYAEHCFSAYLMVTAHAEITTPLREWQQFTRQASNEEIETVYQSLCLTENCL